MSLIILSKSVYATQLCMKRIKKTSDVVSQSSLYIYHMSLLVVVVKQSNVIQNTQGTVASQRFLLADYNDDQSRSVRQH